MYKSDCKTLFQMKLKLISGNISWLINEPVLTNPLPILYLFILQDTWMFDCSETRFSVFNSTYSLLLNTAQAQHSLAGLLPTLNSHVATFIALFSSFYCTDHFIS